MTHRSKVRSIEFPLWLWPNLLSLDAVLVLVAWQTLLARTRGLSVPFPVSVSLAVGVWAIYVVDRIFDGPGVETARHFFAAQHRSFLVGCVGTVVALWSMLILPRLPLQIVLRGLVVAGGCALYLLLVQVNPRSVFAKRIGMSLLCAAGVVLPFWDTSAFLELALTVWLNTKLIDTWEAGANSGLAFRCLLAIAGVFLFLAGGTLGHALGWGCELMLAVDSAGSLISLAAVRCLLDWALFVGACLAAKLS